MLRVAERSLRRGELKPIRNLPVPCLGGHGGVGSRLVVAEGVNHLRGRVGALVLLLSGRTMPGPMLPLTSPVVPDGVRSLLPH